MKWTAEAYWNEMKKIGWLDYFTAEQQQDTLARLRKSFQDGGEWAYLCFSQAGFDTECIDEPGSYCKVLEDLGSYSNGIFHPTELNEEHLTLSKRRHATKVSFQHDGNAFSATVPHDSDWFDMAVVELANRALEASGRPERFMELPSPDQCAFLAIVPPAIYEKAVARKLVPTKVVSD
jgi:hypothetical protein